MNLKEVLDKITEILRYLQYAEYTKDDLTKALQNLIILVGQVLVQRDTAAEKLERYDTHLWISHITGEVDCPTCDSNVPFDFFVGSKGVDGKPLSAITKAKLIELLEFPPISKEDLDKYPIPDFMPDL